MGRQEYLVQCRERGSELWHTPYEARIVSSYTYALIERDRIERYYKSVAVKYDEVYNLEFRIVCRFISDWHEARPKIADELAHIIDPFLQ